VQGQSGFRIVHEFSHFLSASAGDRNLRGPFERVCESGHLDDREAADHGFGFWSRPMGDYTISANDACLLRLDPATVDPDASILCLAYHRVRCLAAGGQ
jgi:hypothetical protein